MGNAWPGARKADKLKAKRKKRGGEVTSGKTAADAAGRKLKTAKRLGSAEAAAALGVPHQKVLLDIMAGRLKGGRSGGKYWVDAEDLERVRSKRD